MYQTMGHDEFYQLSKKKNLAILDVREADEFSAGHVPYSKNFPLSHLLQTFSQLDKQTPYYVICRSGNRSATACEFLSRQGFKVTNILGGTSAWKGDFSQHEKL